MLNDQDIRRQLESYQPQSYYNQMKSSVLIPLIDIDGVDHVLYQIRSQSVSQPGDTAFPGGRVEEGESFKDTSIRETVEELGISFNQIEIYGEIDYIITDRVEIHCFVGRLHHVDLNNLPLSEEVAEVFTVPLEDLINHPPEYYTLAFEHQRSSDFPFERIENGVKYPFREQLRKIPFYDIPGRSLWGFTANLTERFIQIITNNVANLK